MKSLTDVAAPTWRAPSHVASPWGRRPARLWRLLVESWCETMEVYARTGGPHLPWRPFL